MENKQRDPQQRWHKCRECNFKNKLLTNLKYHMNCHTRNERVKCPLCSFSAKSMFHVSRHLKLHHLNMADAMPSHPEYLQEINYVIQHLLEINETQYESINVNNDPHSNLVNEELENKKNDQSEEPVRASASISIQENHNYIQPEPESSLQNKGMRIDPTQFELVNLCDDDDDPMVNGTEMNLFQQQESIKVEERKVEIEEAECRKRISQCKEEIRTARISMGEMREKVRKQKEILSEKQKQKEALSHCLGLIQINNQKITDLSINYKKLETLRTRIKDTKTKTLQSELQLRALQLEELKSKRNLYEKEDDNEDIVIIKSNDEAIKNFKSHIKGMKNELEFLREEERILARDVELLNQHLKVVVKIPDHVLKGIQLEIDELQKGIEKALQDELEDVFNQRIITMEEKIRNLFELKNNLLDIMFLKKSIRSIADGFTQTAGCPYPISIFCIT